MIQALLDRIAPLPDTEEYLATEPDMDDEDTYADWEEKLYKYAEEALAIWEEYETLTEEEQAQMPEEELAKLTVWVEIAGNLSNIEDVVVVSQKETHSHDGNTYVELQPNNLTLMNGTYYLSDDLDMNTITIEGDVTLCLNGRTLTHSGDTGSVIVVNSGTFTLCDCKDNTGCITGGKGEIDGNSLYGGGIFVCRGARFIMLGGTICGNTAKFGGGISIGGGNNNANTSFTMSGGVIEGNTAESQGGGVFCGAMGEMTITNGVIKNNTAESRGGGIFAGTTAKVNLLANAELDKVLVFGNKVGSSGNGGGYAGLGMGSAASIVKIEGNVNITGNKKDNDENNILGVASILTALTLLGTVTVYSYVVSAKSGLNLISSPLEPSFIDKAMSERFPVLSFPKAVSIEATPKNAGADVAMTIQNADNATDTTVAADNIPLAEGENTIKVKVTEGDGVLL